MKPLTLKQLAEIGKKIIAKQPEISLKEARDQAKRIRKNSKGK